MSTLKLRWSAARAALPFAALLLAAAGQGRADEVTDWHGHLLNSLRVANVNAPTATRDAALVSAAVFDAVNGIERRYDPIHVPPAAPRGASKRAAAVQAAYVILLARFPLQADDLAAKRAASLAAFGGEGKSLKRGLEWGQTVAEEILAWRSTDGFAPPPAAFLGGDAPGQWRPAPPSNAPGLVPQFATMTPWVIESPDQFRPAGPPALDSDQYLAEVAEVAEMGSLNSELRTEDETDACRFWASTGPTVLWDRVAMELAADRDFSLSQNAHLLATLNLAMADATISCWDAKYHYVFWRPLTAIRIDDPEWTPLIPTPPHPEYSSGHSSNSSAAATVLAAYFGADTPFVLVSQANPDWMRFFPDFDSALEEVADARVFGGIHFRAACEDGRAGGTAVAEYVMENLLGRVQGGGE